MTDGANWALFFAASTENYATITIHYWSIRTVFLFECECILMAKFDAFAT